MSDSYEPKDVPADLRDALEAWKAKKTTEEAVLVIASRYIAANFIAENIADADEYFTQLDEVQGVNVKVDGLYPDGSLLPKVSASAEFVLKVTAQFPKDEEALDAWQEELGPLTDGLNFFWRFPETELVLGDTDEQGVGYAD